MMDLVSSNESEALVLDLQVIEKKALACHKENYDFLNSLKGLDSSDLNRDVLEISQSVSSQIDCTKCANCCRSLSVGIDYQDISTLANHQETQISDFKNQYVVKDYKNDLVFKQRPCAFLKNNSCSVYSCRPKVCRRYPYLDENNFTERFGNILSNIGVCPIVYNTVELLKLKMNWY